MPKFGRELAYYRPNAELLIGQAGSEVCRFSLDEGRFLAPYVTGLGDVTSLAVASETHHMVALGGHRSAVECWDPRARSCCGLVHLPQSDNGQSAAITKVSFIGGLKLAAGTADGRVVLYDMRSTRPLVMRDHMYEKPINQIMYNEHQNWIISTCSKAMKLWDAETGKPKTAIEPPAKINESIQLDNTGLIFLALEQEKMQTYFIPELGPAPRWCSFLDNLVEEVEETETDTIYDDYKFVTMDELKKLSLDSLVGTNLLRAYMHGYFIDNRLYQKAKVIMINLYFV